MLMWGDAPRKRETRLPQSFKQEMGCVVQRQKEREGTPSLCKTEIHWTRWRWTDRGLVHGHWLSEHHVRNTFGSKEKNNRISHPDIFWKLANRETVSSLRYFSLYNAMKIKDYCDILFL